MLGTGVYGIAEAARYTRLHHARVRSWFVNRKAVRKEALFHSDYEVVNHSYALSFYDLIDVLIAGRLREHGVKMSVVRSAHSILKHKLGTEHPFCHSVIFTDGKEIFIDIAEEMRSEKLAEVITGQGVFEEIILPYLEQIDYSDETKIAMRWRIASGVIVDPKVNLGKPIVEELGTTTHVISSSYFANYKDATFVAEMFGTTEARIHKAVEFERNFGLSSVA